MTPQTQRRDSPQKKRFRAVLRTLVQNALMQAGGTYGATEDLKSMLSRLPEGEQEALKKAAIAESTKQPEGKSPWANTPSTAEH